MFRFLRENFILKAISLLASIVLWLYVTADRYPNALTTRTVAAEVVGTGAAPADVIVRMRPEPVVVEISGPKTEVDGITDGEIKAEVDLRTARLGVMQLKIVRFKMPPGSTAVEVKGRQNVSVDVLPRVRKKIAITPMVSTTAPSGRRYGAPRLLPQWTTIIGSEESVKRVAKVVVLIETSGLSVSADLPIKAEDRDGVEVTGIELEPSSTHVELSLPEAIASRTLVVNVPGRVTAAPGYQLTEVVVEPAQITVMGRPEQLLQLTNIATSEVVIEGLNGESTRQVSLQLPPGVVTATGRNVVRVTYKAREVARPPAGT